MAIDLTDQNLGTYLGDQLLKTAGFRASDLLGIRRQYKREENYHTAFSDPATFLNNKKQAIKDIGDRVDAKYEAVYKEMLGQGVSSNVAKDVALRASEALWNQENVLLSMQYPDLLGDNSVYDRLTLQGQGADMRTFKGFNPYKKKKSKKEKSHKKKKNKK